jgi:hypothetical protein
MKEVGIMFKLDIEEISELGVLGRGQVPWKKRYFTKNYCRMSEVEYAYRLSKCQSYFFEEGGMKGKPDYGRIADEINKKYHSRRKVRDRYKVRCAVWNFRNKGK